ncbi:MAG: hypothetical protein PHQ35_11450, partial [Phycisphaerae bacterium]|nr:hypothetical protein [Phycisphaerae bacterium]
ENQLIEREKDLTQALGRLDTAKIELAKLRKSFDEYESAALQTQMTLLKRITELETKLRGWKTALPISDALTFLGGFFLGHFTQKPVDN